MQCAKNQIEFVAMARKVGRPEKFIITDEVLEEIKKLAANHLNQEEMRHHFNVSHGTWFKKTKADKRVVEAIENGFFQTKKMVVSKFMEHVRSGNLRALMFWLKTQGKWVERVEHVDKSSGTGVGKIEIPKTFSSDPNVAVKQYLEIMG